MTVEEALNNTINIFLKKNIDNPVLDAQVLLAEVLNTDKFKLFVDWENELTKSNITKLNSFIKKRIKGEPVAYITGKKEFYSLDFIVTKDVLIPRPETEQIVDLVIYYAKKDNSVLDIGTGSGAIAVALKINRPDLSVYACDNSEKALKIARKNAKRILGNDSILFSISDLFQAYKGKKFDIILSNPPYLDMAINGSLQKEIFFEPKNALFAGDHGNEIINRLISEAGELLNPDGMLIIEIGNESNIQKTDIGKEFTVTMLNDYANLPRIALLKKN
ncbi:MAG: peptide chain release factor N(5)-glutamine methyltransferase [Spirochaetota bacterium]